MNCYFSHGYIDHWRLTTTRCDRRQNTPSCFVRSGILSVNFLHHLPLIDNTESYVDTLLLFKRMNTFNNSHVFRQNQGCVLKISSFDWDTVYRDIFAPVLFLPLSPYKFLNIYIYMYYIHNTILIKWHEMCYMLGLLLLSCRIPCFSGKNETMNCRELILRNKSFPGHLLNRYVYCISKEMLAASTSASIASLWAT